MIENGGEDGGPIRREMMLFSTNEIVGLAVFGRFPEGQFISLPLLSQMNNTIHCRHNAPFRCIILSSKFIKDETKKVLESLNLGLEVVSPLT